MKKICIVTTSLGKGGAERSSAILTQMISKLGHEVHVLMTKNDIDYEFSGVMFNLEETHGNNLSIFRKIQILRAYFEYNHFDVIIDNRPRNIFIKEFFLYHFVFKANQIISIVHSYYLNMYLPKSQYMAKLIYTNKSQLVTVSQKIYEKVQEHYKFKNCIQIYNPIAIDDVKRRTNVVLVNENRFILFYGRIDEKVKNLTLLIDAYRSSELIKKGIKLYIMGDGGDVPFLKQKILNLDLGDYVCYFPFNKNPFAYVKKALFSVLTSKHEGFPMVLIESLACGTPVVSVDCESGPKEIIIHQENGLLVENNNPRALAQAFNFFIEDKELYKRCKQNAQQSVEKFSIEKITKQWKAILE